MQKLLGRQFGKVWVYLSAIVLCGFSVVPVLWAISTSLKPNDKIYSQIPKWMPDPLTFEHYFSVLNNKNMLHYFFNSFVISLGATVASLVVCILAAYGFSRYKFPGKKMLLWSILFTVILPRVTIIVPFYIILKNINLINTYSGLVLAYMIFIIPTAVWLLKGYFDNIPYEIEEAATMDGCSPLGILLRIIIPISMPTIASVAMFSFVLAWNEFLFALVFTSGAEIRPLAVGLSFFIDEEGVKWGELMAASILMSIPVIFIFSLSQKFLVKGLSDGAVKG
jgi:multiple sugar transport system permease protein